MISGTLSVMPHPDDVELAEESTAVPASIPAAPAGAAPAEAAREVGGREGPEPTRFGDWELRGRCVDF
ncbi:MAG: hypothetical protein NVS9B2_11310 [Steroidobacteraceae bacterium]